MRWHRTSRVRPRRVLSVAIGATLVLALAACSSGEDDASSSTTAPTTTASTTTAPAGSTDEPDGTGASSDDLVGSAWRLVAVDRADGSTDSAADGVAAIVTFEDGTTLGAYDGVNFTAGTYRLDGEALAVELDPPSEIEYPDEDLVQYELLELLADATTLTVSDGELVVGLDGGGSLRLEAATSGLSTS
jgi:heat shock protein HslJ